MFVFVACRNHTHECMSPFKLDSEKIKSNGAFCCKMIYFAVKLFILRSQVLHNKTPLLHRDVPCCTYLGNWLPLIRLPGLNLIHHLPCHYRNDYFAYC